MTGIIFRSETRSTIDPTARKLLDPLRGNNVIRRAARMPSSFAICHGRSRLRRSYIIVATIAPLPSPISILSVKFPYPRPTYDVLYIIKSVLSDLLPWNDSVLVELFTGFNPENDWSLLFNNTLSCRWVIPVSKPPPVPPSCFYSKTYPDVLTYVH